MSNESTFDELVTEALAAPPAFMGWFFLLFGSMFIIAGWTLAGFIFAAGRKLKKRVSWMFCLVVAGVECIFSPFGTILGVFTIFILMKDSVKELFAVKQPIQATLQKE